jgi:hypothetical protein
MLNYAYHSQFDKILLLDMQNTPLLPVFSM